MINKLKEIGMSILNPILLFISIVIFILGVRWLGFKGVVGLLIGLCLMGYLVVSGNPLFLSFIELLSPQKKEKVKYVKRKWL